VVAPVVAVVDSLVGFVTVPGSEEAVVVVVVLIASEAADPPVVGSVPAVAGSFESSVPVPVSAVMSLLQASSRPGITARIRVRISSG
jgi:hypothetical protein